MVPAAGAAFGPVAGGVAAPRRGTARLAGTEAPVMDWYVEKAVVVVLPRKSCRWLAPGWPGRTMGSSCREWL